MQELKFYVYAYLREDGSPYYIGKGTGKRAWRKEHTISPPVNKSLIVICENNLTELGAWSIERRLIRWYGRQCDGSGTLRNFYEGGTGGPVPEDVRQKISKTRKEQGQSEANLAATKAGINQYIANLSPEEHRKRFDSRGSKNNMYGKNHTPNTKELLRKKNGRPIQCNETGEVFQSQNEAAEKLNLRQCDINNMLGGRQRSVRGLTFSYYMHQ